MNYRFSTELDEMDIDVIHAFLSTCYWCRGIPRATLEKAMRHSLNFGVLEGPNQIAYGRFVSDQATFAYLADVFVVDSYRGMGVGKMMMQRAMALPEVQGLRRMMLATRDAHGLYAPLGFEQITEPELFMQHWIPDIYD